MSEPLSQIPDHGHAVIEASAGTGKTYALEHLVVELLLTGVPLPRILVVTFTDKAANELRTRVRKLLEEMLGEAGEGRALLQAALRDFDSACISTIHAFCQQVLTENAFANHRLFDEELVDGKEQFSRAFRDVLRTRLAVDPELRELLGLWREQRTIGELEQLLHACEERRGRVVPGYDRAALTRAVAALPSRADALSLVAHVHANSRTKTREALEGLHDALDRFAPDASGIAAYGALRGQTDRLDYLVAPLTKAGRRHPAAGACAQALIELRLAIPPIEALVAGKLGPLVRERLGERKTAEGLFDFQDMLALVDEALAGPRGAALLLNLRARFSHALIDEFQDTDEVQWSVFRRIFVGSEEHRLILVGDPKQAIYGFRGADVQTYLCAKAEILKDQRPVVLSQNFRSTQPLVEACNSIFAGDYFGAGIVFEPASCGKPERVLVDPERPAPVHVFVTGMESVGRAAVYPRLGPAMAREIQRLVDPSGPVRWCGERLEHRDVYVLGRGGVDLESVAVHLREAGVPFAFYRQDGLFQSREAQALEDVLAAVADPDDRAQRFRAWMTPLFGLSLTDLASAAQVGEDDPLMQRLRTWHRLAAKRDYERLFTSMLEDSGLSRRLLLFEPGERSLTNFLHVLEVLREQFGVRRASLADMVQGLRALRQGVHRPPGQNGNLQRLETERDAVQLMTLHASKGLQAPVVFVVGGLAAPPGDKVHTLHLDRPDGTRERLALVGDSPKDLYERAKQESAQEDRRLLYVALTRAKARLYLPFAGTRGSQEGPVPSRRVTGCYRAVNSRLAELLSVPSPLFSHEALRAGEEIVARPTASRVGICVPEDLLVEPVPAGLEALRRRHAGFTTTSFTRLHDRMEGPASEVKSETRDRAPPGEDELPGGAATGSFLHEVLAAVPPEIACRCRDPEEFAARPEVARLFESWAARYGIERRHLPHAHALVHTALTSPIPLGPGRAIRGIASAERLLREMDFLYPIPEAVHPRLDQPCDEGGPPFAIERGFVTGFVDVLFEHEGLTYFADWKSNCLAGFEARRVADEVRQAYALQGRLYTLALVKMLGLHDERAYDERFGGLLFLFLRGLTPGGEGARGVYFDRPGWRDVLAWESELRGLDLERGEA